MHSAGTKSRGKSRGERPCHDEHQWASRTKNLYFHRLWQLKPCKEKADNLLLTILEDKRDDLAFNSLKRAECGSHIHRNQRI